MARDGQGSSYRRYLAGLFGAFLMLMVVSVASTLVLGTVVAPKFSRSLAFNQKAVWLRDVGHCDVLVVGSSMALNNVDGPYLLKQSGYSSLVNTGSWGLTIDNAKRLAAAVEKRCHPRLVVIPVYYGDFSSPNGKNRDASLEVDWDHVDRYLAGGSRIAGIFDSFDITYMLRSYRELGEEHYRSPRYYTSLKFDATGGVLLASSGFHVDAGRWSGYREVASERVVPGELNALGELVSGFAARGVHVIVVKTPLTRDGRAAFATNDLESTWRSVKSKVVSRGGRFLDTEDLGLSDDNFVDFCHLNENGARVVSRSIADEAKRTTRVKSEK